MDVLQFSRLDTYLHQFFCACISEDEEPSLLRPISRWRLFELTLIQTDRPVVGHICTGRKCTSRRCMAQILIWIDDSWLISSRLMSSSAEGSDSCPAAQAQIHQPVLRFIHPLPHDLFLLLPSPVDWGWRSASDRCTNLFRLWRKKRMALNILQ